MSMQLHAQNQQSEKLKWVGREINGKQEIEDTQRSQQLEPGEYNRKIIVN